MWLTYCCDVTSTVSDNYQGAATADGGGGCFTTDLYWSYCVTARRTATVLSSFSTHVLVFLYFHVGVLLFLTSGRRFWSLKIRTTTQIFSVLAQKHTVYALP